MNEGVRLGLEEHKGKRLLTQMVGAAQVEGVAAMDVVVEGLLNEVLRLIPSQLSYPAKERTPDAVSGLGLGAPGPERLLSVPTHLESKKISFMSRLARNMNILLCSLISVTALGGSEWPTATNPTFW